MLNIQKKLSNAFYALLSLPATGMGFALSVQISALSWILSNKYGLYIHDVGLVWAAGPIAGIIGQVLIGLISDNVWFWNGRRRPFILIGGVLGALMLLALPNIDVISSSTGVEGILGVAITVALILDLAINVSFNPTRSIIADVTPDGDPRTKGYAWMQTVSGSLSVGAYAIGAYWDNYVLIYVGVVVVFLTSIIPPFFIEEPRELTSTNDQPQAEHTSLRNILLSIKPLWGFLIYDIYAMTLRLAHIEVNHYWVEFICLAITIVLVIQAVSRSEANKSQEAANQIGFQKVLAAHSFSWVGVHTMFVYMLFYIQDKYPMMESVDQGRVVSWSFLILNGVAAILPVALLEPLTKKWGRVKTHYLCMATMAGGYVGLILLGQVSIWVIYLFMVICGVGWAAIISLPFAIMSQKVEKSKMGLYMGLFNLSVVLPQLVASLGVGYAINQVENKSLIFTISAVALAISFIAWTFVQDDDGETPPVGGPSAH
ncbi:MAG: MFS transporter [Bacteroidota bacterium]